MIRIHSYTFHSDGHDILEFARMISLKYKE